MQPDRFPITVVDDDHVTKTADHPLLVIYGDYQCPFTTKAIGEVGRMLASDVPFTFVYRHFPLDKHPDALLAARAAEAATLQDRFWQLHVRMFQANCQLDRASLIGYATEVGLDAERFDADLDDPAVAERVERDLASGRELGVAGTPTFFANGHRHYGDHDVPMLTDLLRRVA